MSEHKQKNFIEHIIEDDIQKGKVAQIITRFPPEPNGYLHFGHAKAIHVNYGIAKKYNGKFNLRFDDTDPSKEKHEYVESMKEDVKWLGADYGDRCFFASSYFEELYENAVELIKRGKAYVCDLSSDELREYRGTLTKPGIESPYRERSVDENLKLFEKMKNGDFPDGSKTLRAKIDMASPNMNMRDPAIYRISHKEHYAAKKKWCVYPLYDFAHPIEDAIEGVTHSCCGLEFEDHRPLYDWFLKELDWKNPPKQIEFAEINLSHSILGKRKIKPLIEEGILDGWDDPRLMTIRGMIRRGYTSSSIRSFYDMIGLSRAKSTVDISMLEHALREDLKLRVPRVLAVLNPLKVTITNYTEEIEWLDAPNNVENEELGRHKIPFTKEIYIEADDFKELAPNKKYKRLVLGQEVRLMHAYFIKCNEVIKDEKGNILELLCTYDAKTKSGSGFKERKPRGTIGWVSATEGINVTARFYDYLFVDKVNGEQELNTDSLTIFSQCYVEPYINELNHNDKLQFIRIGYFNIDAKDSSQDELVLNQAVSLKSSYK